MANDINNVVNSEDNETVKTKKKEKSVLKSVGKVALGLAAIGGIVLKVLNGDSGNKDA